MSSWAKAGEFFEAHLKTAPNVKWVPQSDWILLNLAEIFLSRNELDLAIRAVQCAAQAGIKNKKRPGDRIFDPIRSRAEFQSILNQL